MLGKSDFKTVGLLEEGNPKKGIYVQYGGGAICMNGEPDLIGKPRQTKFKLVCDSEQDINVNRKYLINIIFKP